MGITISPWMMAFLMLMTGFAGFVDSAAGGGGLISLPAYLFAGLPPHYTYATNKFSAACGTTFATASFFKSGAMNVKVGVLAAIGSFAGSALGAHIVLLLSDEMLRTMMFIILPVAAVIILWQRNLPDENRDDGTLNLKKILLALGIVYLLLAWWRKLPVFGFCVSGGYLLGLALGLAFAVQGTDPGGGATSNAWLIWLMVYQATVLLGWLWDLRKKRRA